MRKPIFLLPLLLTVACATEDTFGGSGGSATGAGGPGGAADGGNAANGGNGAGPTCNDATKNGDETDVDCGGSCSPCASAKGCASSSDCASAFCADGVCCNTACEGLCEACSQAKTGTVDGTCAPVTVGADPDAECAMTPVAQCGVAGLGCDGSGACALYPQGAECAAPSCVNGTATTAASCDGAGICVPGTSSDCGDYACNAQTSACKTSCTDDTDCVAPAACNGSICTTGTVTLDTHNFNGLTEYPLDTDVCQCCGGTTTAQTATAFCVLAGYTTAVSWTTGMVSGTNCYCYDCISVDTWVSNCCSGLDNRPMILTVTCQ